MLSVDAFAHLHEEGYRCAASGDWRGAIARYEEALIGVVPGIEYPALAAVHGNLMQCYVYAARVDEAWEQATYALQILTTLPADARSNLVAQLAWFFGERAPATRLGDALAIVTAVASELEGGDAMAALGIKMRILMRMGRDDEAKAVARVALALDPEHPEFADAKSRWGLGRSFVDGPLPSFLRLVDVKGIPPRPTLGMRGVYSRGAKRLFFFGGDKRAVDVASDDEVRQRNQVFALVPRGDDFTWQGPVASDVSDPLENFETAVLPRSQHVFIESANRRYLLAHGGTNQDGRGVTFMNQGGLADLLAFDTTRLAWTPLTSPLAAASSTPMLVGHAGAFDLETGRVIIVRAASTDEDLVEEGLSPDDGLGAIVLETSGEPAHWTHRKLVAKGKGPSPRAGFRVAIAGRRLVVFGGAYARTVTGTWETSWPDDVMVLDLETFVWSTLPIRGERPEGRIDHGLIPIDDHRVLVVGGRQGFGDHRFDFADFHVLDLDRRTFWRAPLDVKLPPGAEWVGWDAGSRRRVIAVGGDVDGVPVFELDLAALLAGIR